MNFYQHDVEEIARNLEGEEQTLARKKEKVSLHQNKWPLLSMYEGKRQIKAPPKIENSAIFQAPGINSNAEKEQSKPRNPIRNKLTADKNDDGVDKRLFTGLNRKNGNVTRDDVILKKETGLAEVFDRIVAAAPTAVQEEVPQVSGSMFSRLKMRSKRHSV